MATLLNSSIGKKLIQSISGLFLIVFLLLHGTINFFSVIDTFTGNFGSAEGLFAKGCEFMALPIVTIMVPVLALGFVVHIAYGIYLTIGNLRARGGVNRYEVASKAKTDSWAAKNMLVLGIIVLGLLAFHMNHFWAHMQLQEFIGSEAEDPYMLLCATFGHWWVVVLYLVWFVAVGLHICHGFWSALHTMGFNNSIWMKRLKVLSAVVAVVIVVMFSAVAINACCQAVLW